MVECMCSVRMVSGRSEVTCARAVELECIVVDVAVNVA